MTSLLARRREISLLIAAALVAAFALIAAQPAHADVTGGCDGSVDFTADDVGVYTPDNDTRDNPVIVVKDDGNLANWEGSVPGLNTNFSGKVEIRIGPSWIEVADWGAPDHDGSNSDDIRTDDGVYNMDELWDVIPKNIAQGIYEARAVHKADSVDCEAQFFVKFEGDPLSSPIVIVVIILAIIFLALMIVAGRRRAKAGFFAGRPVLAVISSLLFALMLAVLLQQFCVWPLDNLTVIILPLVFILIGLVIAKFAPFGGVSPGIAEMARREAKRAAAIEAAAAVPEPAASTFADGLDGETGGEAVAVAVGEDEDREEEGDREEDEDRQEDGDEDGGAVEDEPDDGSLV